MSDLNTLLRAAHDVVARGRAVAFWVAVVTPFVYLPLALVGLPTGSDYALFAGLVTVHVLALYLGRSYHSPDSAGTPDVQRPETDTAQEVRA